MSQGVPTCSEGEGAVGVKVTREPTAVCLGGCAEDENQGRFGKPLEQGMKRLSQALAYGFCPQG